MKKKFVAEIICISMLLIIFTGCGDKGAMSSDSAENGAAQSNQAENIAATTDSAVNVAASSDPAENRTPQYDSVENETLKSDLAKEKDSASENKEYGSADKETTDDPVNTEDEDIPGSSLDNETFSAELNKAFADGEVENNGGWFVRAGNKVYYRLFNTRELQRTTLWGNIEELEEEQESELKCYDLDARNVETVGKVVGNGKLFATTEGFVLKEPLKAGSVLITSDGKTKRPYLSGNPVAVSEDGKYLATTDYPEAGGDVSHIVYCEGVEAYRFTEDDANYVNIFGFAGDDLIVMNCFYSENRYVICAYDENGQCTELGEINSDDDELMAYPEFEQMISDGSDVYIMLAYYEGTGHFLAHYNLFKVEKNKVNSMSEIQTDWSGEEEVVPQIYLSSGSLAFANHLQGELGEVDGSLVYYDTPDHYEILKNYFISYPYGDNLYGDFLHEAVAFGDFGFALSSSAHRDELGDIGWRYAYDLNRLDYTVIPFGKDDLDEEELAKNSEFIEMLYSAGWGDGDIAIEALSGTWQMYSYEAEGTHGYAEEDGFFETLEFGNDGKLTYTYWNKEADPAATVRELEQVSPDGDDIAFSYETDDGKLHIDILALHEDKLDISTIFYYEDGMPGGSEGVFLKQ